MDELLVEILCRLPCHNTVVICKCVCKHWAALLSQPYFIRRFVLHKRAKDPTFGFVVRNMAENCREDPPHENTWKGLMIRFNDPTYNPKNISVSSLRRLTDKLPYTLTVIGACNDLLLYERNGGYIDYAKLELYIGNAQTRQWHALPPLTMRSGKEIGMICEPYYNFDTTSDNVTLNNAYHACVIIIPTFTRDQLEREGYVLYLLSRNTGGTWRTVLLSLPSPCKQICFCNPFSIGRKFYVHCINYVLGVDPFTVDNDVIKCELVRLPRYFESTAAIFGVFHEQLYTVDGTCAGTYRLWVLEDYETGLWSLRHSIEAQDWIPRDLSLAKWSPLFGKPISFHPSNPDFIYVLCDHWILLFNFSTREMEVASVLSKLYVDLYPDGCSFQIALPAWPSPLPNLGI